MYIHYIYKKHYPTITEYVFFPNLNVTLTKIDHIRSHKASLNKFQMIQSIHPMFSHHNKSCTSVTHR